MTSKIVDSGHSMTAKKGGNLEEITYAEIGKIDTLARRCRINDDNMLGYSQEGQVKALSRSQLIMILGLSEKRGRQFIKRMIDLEALQRVDTDSETQYYVADEYVWKGMMEQIGIVFHPGFYLQEYINIEG